MEDIEFTHPNLIIKFVSLFLSFKGDIVYQCNFTPFSQKKFKFQCWLAWYLEF